MNSLTLRGTWTNKFTTRHKENCIQGGCHEGSSNLFVFEIPKTLTGKNKFREKEKKLCIQAAFKYEKRVVLRPRNDFLPCLWMQAIMHVFLMANHALDMNQSKYHLYFIPCY